MSIKIDQIEAESLGPLSNFKEKLTPITLIYGHNEKGKTFLVELLLTSLFKNLSGFKNELRIKKTKGKVIVVGIENDPVIFSPTSNYKLENKWEKNGQGMPPNIARLLVVKSGDTEIDKSTAGGVSRDTIREFLSSQDVLDAIQNNIPLKGTREALIEEGIIDGPNTGDIKRRKDVQKEIDNIVRLLDRINFELADGDVIALEKQISQLKERMDSLEAAKKHAAYRLSQREQKIIGKIQRFENAKFEVLDENFKNYLRKQEELSKKRIEKENADNESKHYLWLKKAVDEYQNLFRQKSKFTLPTLLIVSYFLLVIAVILIAIGLYWPSIFFIVSAIGLGFLYLMKAKQSQFSQLGFTELENIRTNFEEKFKESCEDLATMQAKLEAITSSYHASQLLEKNIESDNQEIKDLEFEIRQSLIELGIDTPSPKDWDETITQLRQDLKGLHNELTDVKKELARYDVDPSDFLEEDPGVKYERNIYDEAKSKKEALDKELEDLEQSLQNLKSEIQGMLSDHSLTDWGELIHKLREIKLEKVEQYKYYTTEIIAGNLLNQVVEQNLELEDQKLLGYLKSDYIRIPLAQIAQNYIGVDIDDEGFKAVDEYNRKFDFKDLSTGAREQILLALRIGFAKKVMQGNSAFLIFDDAFQHSDWIRRPRLVDTMFELAKQDWQIIYFSMDDNIKDLFDKRGKNERKGLYTRINL